MHTSRQRTLYSNAGLLTAVTLSLCLLSGCNGARFLMGPDPSQGVQISGSPTGQGASGAASTPAKPLVFDTLKGHVSLNGQALSNATVRVFDALTNKPAGVIAAGGANYEVTQSNMRPLIQVTSASATTDASGAFSFQVAGLTPGTLARVVATKDGKTLTALVAGDGTMTSARYAVQATTEVELSETSTGLSTLAEDFIPVFGTLTPDASASLITNTLSQLNSLAPKVQQATQNQGALNQLLTAIDSETGRHTNPDAVNQFTAAAGLGADVSRVLKTASQSVAQRAQDHNNVVQGALGDVKNGAVAGSSLQISVSNGNLIVTDSATGDATVIPLVPATDDGVSSPGVDGVSASATVTGDPAVAPVVTSTAFNPTVGLSYAGGVLTVNVSQPAGSDDIAAVFARLPKGSASLADLSLAAHNTLSVAGSQVVTTAYGTRALTVVRDAAAAGAVVLPPRFASATVSNPVWAGYIQDGSTKLARFQVFDSGSYYYLVTTYNLTDAVRTSGGHTTTLKTDALATLTTGTPAEITLVSRLGNTVDRNSQVL